ncbi:peptidylprolyl isomerase [Sorangium cellulosum]|uniref:peptidylprolyl isomerase n=1 Tax=Sorangium TaxID=39643 RepID=UPI00101A1984
MGALFFCAGDPRRDADRCAGSRCGAGRWRRRPEPLTACGCGHGATGGLAPAGGRSCDPRRGAGPRCGARAGGRRRRARHPRASVVEFEQALEKVAVGSLSGAVETAFGFHIILRTR